MAENRLAVPDTLSNEFSTKQNGALQTPNQDVCLSSRTVMMDRKQAQKMLAQRRDRGAEHVGSEPLDDANLETLAQELAMPPAMREFKSVEALAKHYGVSRMTIYRRSHYPAVLQRAACLSKRNKLAGVVIARANYESMIQAQVKKALSGDTQAARFLHEIASAEELPDSIRVQTNLVVQYVEGQKYKHKQDGIQQGASSSTDPAPR